MRTRILVTILVCAVALIVFENDPIVSAQDRFSGRTVTGTAYFIGGRRSTRSVSVPFTLIIDRLSSPGEISQMNTALQSGGQDELLRVLSRIEAGRIQLGPGVGVPANAIIAKQEGERTKLIVLYERYIRFAEMRYGLRSQDYPFGYAELYVGAGANEGMIIPAAKVRLRGSDTWEVEDFGTFPGRLMGLQLRGRGRVPR